MKYPVKKMYDTQQKRLKQEGYEVFAPEFAPAGNTQYPLTSASGAIPTPPMPLSSAAIIPATCDPCV